MKLSTAMMNYVNFCRHKKIDNVQLARRVQDAIAVLESWQWQKLRGLTALVREKHSISKMVFGPDDFTCDVDLTRKCDAWEDLADMICDEIEI